VLELDRDAEPEGLAESLRKWSAAGSIDGVYWLPALDAEGDVGSIELGEWRSAIKLRVKLLYAGMRELFADFESPGRFLVCGTRLGGRHGYDEEGALHPMGGAVSGFAKAFARERPDAVVKVVDFPESRKTAALADALIEETLRDPGAVEIGVQGDRRFTVALQEGPIRDADAGGVALGEGAVVLMTGAAGSIVSAITADLAAGGGTFHLLDLEPAPDPDDADIRQFAADREELKRALVDRMRAGGERVTPVQVERELARIERAHAAATAVRAVEASGGTVRWHQVDLTDADGVSKVIDEVREDSGCIDVLVHAAGMERSHHLPDKAPEEFDLIFDVKCDGWFNLVHAIGDLPVGAVVFFSSISGRFGNGGQTDYSAANDLLCKSASQFRSARPDTRAIAIDWTAWAEIGMASRGSIPDMMAAAGIDMLDPAAGIPVVRQEVTAGGPSGEILVAGALGLLVAERDETGGLDPQSLADAARGPMVGMVAGMDVQQGLRIVTRLDPAEQPFLDHHRIEGTPVLPGVMGVEGFVEAARLLFPGLSALAVEGVEFLAPFKFYRDQPREVEIRARFEVDGDDVLAACELWGRRQLVGREESEETLHFRGRVRLGAGDAPAERSDLPPAADGALLADDDLYRVYFHGPAYRVLAQAWRAGDTVAARYAESLPQAHVPEAAALETPVRLVELCFQAAGAWEIAASGCMGLPQRIDRLTLAGSGEGEGGIAIVSRSGEGRWDAVVVDHAGNRVLGLEGYATVALPAQVEPALREPLKAALNP
jgi:NAD(P)-dependent dehydrogenase (short-subunit alcohol dehydrogenase family)